VLVISFDSISGAIDLLGFVIDPRLRQPEGVRKNELRASRTAGWELERNKVRTLPLSI